MIREPTPGIMVHVRQQGVVSSDTASVSIVHVRQEGVVSLEPASVILVRYETF